MWYKVISIKIMKIQTVNPPYTIKPSFSVSFGKSNSDFAKIVETAKNEFASRISDSPTFPNVKILLDKLTEKIVQELDENPIGDKIIDWCSNFCKSFHRSDFMQDKGLPEQTRDNVIVEFLNFLCHKHKISSCIFISDLRKTT